jgi:hypothetical protein
MQQGKHTEYEKNLHDELMAATAAAEMAEASGSGGVQVRKLCCCRIIS